MTRVRQDPQEPLERRGLGAYKASLAPWATRAPQALQGPLAQPSVEQLVLKGQLVLWDLRA